MVCHSATRVNSIENDSFLGTVAADVATVNGGESPWVVSTKWCAIQLPGSIR